LSKEQTYNKKYYQNNKEQYKKLNRRWRSENRDKTNELNRQWRRNNRERYNEYQRIWHSSNREKGRNYQRLCGLRLKMLVLSHYSNPLECSICKIRDMRCLSIDHISGGGNKHRARINRGNRGGGAPFYRWLKRKDYPAGFRVLCANCQVVERYAQDLGKLQKVMDNPKLMIQYESRI